MLPGGYYHEEPRDSARAALTATILARLTAAEAARDAAVARAERLEGAVNATLDDACRMSAILLMTGEMVAEERWIARAVAYGIAAKVRAALALRAPVEET